MNVRFLLRLSTHLFSQRRVGIRNVTNNYPTPTPTPLLSDTNAQFARSSNKKTTSFQGFLASESQWRIQDKAEGDAFQELDQLLTNALGSRVPNRIGRAK